MSRPRARSGGAWHERQLQVDPAAAGDLAMWGHVETRPLRLAPVPPREVHESLSSFVTGLDSLKGLAAKALEAIREEEKRMQEERRVLEVEREALREEKERMSQVFRDSEQVLVQWISCVSCMVPPACPVRSHCEPGDS